MSELLVIGFKDQYRASEVSNELRRRREWNWVAALDHSVALRVDELGKLSVQLSVDLTTREGAAWARVWGSFLRLVLWTPVTNDLSSAADEMVDGWASAGKSEVMTNSAKHGEQLLNEMTFADVTWWRETVQISDKFVRDIGAMIEPGDSALFIILKVSQVAVVLRVLKNYGGTLLHKTLSREQDEQLDAVLNYR